MTAKCLVSIWAHPDDEAFGPVGVIRAAHEAGIRNVLITATHGEGGRLGNPALATRETLARVRDAELQAAAAIIGFDRVDQWDYPDGKLKEADPAELRERILAVLVEENPELVLTFGPDGIYGHPDHIAIHVAATQAFAQYAALQSLEAEPRLYYVTVDPDRERTPNDAGDAGAPAPLPATAVVDVSRYAEVKRRALAAHATQNEDWGPLLELPGWLSKAYLHRAFPPFAAGQPTETAIFE
ncbi:MAG TPA: PIG-L family deacetylase [Herpetosiphonaceae bacterium]|nr:PIG-L family deacetylase [Herpetosiphonaceae bacterium]